MKKTIQILVAALLLCGVFVVIAAADEPAIDYLYDRTQVETNLALLDGFISANQTADAPAYAVLHAQTEETASGCKTSEIVCDAETGEALFRCSWENLSTNTQTTLAMTLDKSKLRMNLQFFFAENEAKALRMSYPVLGSAFRWLDDETLCWNVDVSTFDYNGDIPKFGIYTLLQPSVHDAMKQWDRMLNESGTLRFYQLGFFRLCPEHDYVFLDHADATHLLAGYDRYQCTKCYFRKVDTLPLVPHTFGDWIVTQAATCSAAGQEKRVCAECGYEETRAIPATAHTFETVKFPAKRDQGGGKETHCVVCGYVKSRRVTYPGYSAICLDAYSPYYDGKVKTPKITVQDSNGDTIPAKYYKVKYSSGRKDVGVYTVRVTFNGGKYEGTLTKKFKILPAPITKLKAAARGDGVVKLAWTPSAGAQRYAVYFRKVGETALQKAGGTSKRVYYVKNLNPGETYQFVVRPVTKVNGTNYWGSNAVINQTVK